MSFVHLDEIKKTAIFLKKGLDKRTIFVYNTIRKRQENSKENTQ